VRSGEGFSQGDVGGSESGKREKNWPIKFFFFSLKFPLTKKKTQEGGERKNAKTTDT
jgi:hypothetical protein